MDIEELRQEIQHHRDLIKSHQRHKKEYERQAALAGDLHVSPHVKIQIEDLSGKIKASENIIQDIKDNYKSRIQLKIDDSNSKRQQYIGTRDRIAHYFRVATEIRDEIKTVLPKVVDQYLLDYYSIELRGASSSVPSSVDEALGFYSSVDIRIRKVIDTLKQDIDNYNYMLSQADEM